MNPDYYRKPITDLLIAELKALKYADGASDAFADVLPIMVERADATPVCEILPTNTGVQIEGLPEDTRLYSYALVVYDRTEATSTNEAAKNVLDRLQYLEDIVYRHFEAVPNPIERDIEGIHIYNIEMGSAQYNAVQRELGIGLILQINITLYVTINTRLLNNV